MALKKNVVLDNGLDVDNAYIRVENPTVHEKKAISFGVSIRKNVSLSELQRTIVACAYDLDGENPIKQAYEYLKTLPEFEGATDV